MATSQRISRGFHRLAIFSAAVPFLIGVPLSVLTGLEDANIALLKHEKLTCAHKSAGTITDKPWTLPWKAFVEGDRDKSPSNDPLDDWEVSLKKLGCSEWDYDTAKLGEIRDVAPTFNWLGTFGPPLMLGLAITLAVTLAVYGLVRAIGWVVGGFAA
jgi:hypothetical protein